MNRLMKTVSQLRGFKIRPLFCLFLAGSLLNPIFAEAKISSRALDRSLTSSRRMAAPTPKAPPNSAPLPPGSGVGSAATPSTASGGSNYTIPLLVAAGVAVAAVAYYLYKNSSQSPSNDKYSERNFPEVSSPDDILEEPQATGGRSPARDSNAGQQPPIDDEGPPIPEPVAAQPIAKADETVGVKFSKERAEILNYTNEWRKAQKLPPLKQNARCEKSAQSYADELVKRAGQLMNQISNPHIGADGSNFKDRFDRVEGPNGEYSLLAENLAFGHSSAREAVLGKSPKDGNAAVKGWLQSEGHLKNLLGNSTGMGVGVAFVPPNTVAGFQGYIFVQCLIKDGKPELVIPQKMAGVK